MKFKGEKTAGARRYDYVALEAYADRCEIGSFDGDYRETAWATLSLPTARKLANAILKAVDAADGGK